MRGPKRSAKASTVLGRIGAPTEYTLGSVVKAERSALGAFISAMNTVIEPTVKVAPISLIVLIASVGSNRWKSTRSAPVNSDTLMCPIRAVTWNSGATPSRTPSPLRSIQSR